MPAAQTPVAPAFGTAAPYPPRAGTPAAAPADSAGSAPLTFPTFTPFVPEVAPVAPPLPRAPELMGADELAAPPRSIPPLSGPVPTLVSPPEYGQADTGDPGAPGSLPAYEPVQPVTPQPFAARPDTPQPYTPPPVEIASAPAPSAPALFAPESAAPAAASPAMPMPGMTPAPASTPAAAPRDFASLLSAPFGADDDASAAAAPLRFGSAPSDDDDDEPDIGRSTTAEKVGLVLAFLVAPIGLIAGIVAAVRSAQRRGWVVGIVRASIAIAAVLSVALGIGGYYEYTQIKLQQAHDQISAASAQFCSTIKANPGMKELPTFGWPGVAHPSPSP